MNFYYLLFFTFYFFVLCVQYPDDDDGGNNNDAFISFKHSASTHRQLWLKFSKMYSLFMMLLKFVKFAQTCSSFCARETTKLRIMIGAGLLEGDADRSGERAASFGIQGGRDDAQVLQGPRTARAEQPVWNDNRQRRRSLDYHCPRHLERAGQTVHEACSV